MNKKTIIILSLWVFIIAVIIISCNVGKNNEPKPEHNKSTAAVVAKDFVKKSLKSPSTAKFPWYTESAVKDLGDGRYTYTSYVDSQNSFGAIVRTNFTCTVKYIGNDQWTCEELKFN